MRTLIVSRGWHTRASIIPAPPPAVAQSLVFAPTRRFKTGVSSTDQVDRGRGPLIAVCSFGSHDVNRSRIVYSIYTEQIFKFSFARLIPGPRNWSQFEGFVKKVECRKSRRHCGGSRKYTVAGIEAEAGQLEQIQKDVLNLRFGRD